MDQNEINRMMDEGDVPFVLYDGRRVMVPDDYMWHFGLKQGQTVDDATLKAILDRAHQELESIGRR